MRTGLFCLFLFLSLFLTVQGQERPLYDQYYLNSYLYNPAYAGKNYGNVFLLHNNRWAQLEGSPKCNVFTIDGSLTEKIGLGFQFFNESKGLSRRNEALLTYAYRINISDEEEFGFGVSAGVLSEGLDFSKAIVKTPGDPIIPLSNKKTFAPAAAAGIMFRYDDFTCDLALPEALGNSLKYTEEGRTALKRIPRKINASAKYQIKAEKQHIKVIPGVMANYSGGPMQFDLNVMGEWNDALYLGASYKSKYAVVAMAGFKVNEFRFGYAYEVPTGSIRSFSGPGHEVAVSYMFYTKKDKKGKLPTAKVKRIEEKIKKLKGDLKIQETALKRKEKDVLRMIDRYYLRIKKGMKAESPESLKQRKAIEVLIEQQNAIQAKIDKINKQMQVKQAQLDNQ